MKPQPRTLSEPTPTPAPAQYTVNQAQNTAAFWYAELAPVSFFAPPAVQNAPVNENDKHVIPMATVPGYCAA